MKIQAASDKMTPILIPVTAPPLNPPLPEIIIIIFKI
jgi:hypothetical protein